ncbi:MAG: ArsA family ATPase [Candidatus Binataceae bacterium]
MSAGLVPGGCRLVICLGPGGVGKTTFSAALALEAAMRGREVDVMTIDPAPRLIDALGLEADGVEPQIVALGGLRAKSSGRLRALRLDPKSTFDALIARYAPSPAAHDAIIAGRIYQNLSSALAGVADYMAIEKLLELYREDGAELIVLDTPPAREALDFLDAPRRMLELMSSRAITLLGASRSLLRAPLGALDLAARAVLSAFDRLTGLHLLADVQGFVRGFEGMYDGFAARAAEAEALIRAPATFIVLVTTAEKERVDQADEFARALRKMGLRVGAVAVNRLMVELPEVDEIERARLSTGLKAKLRRNLAEFAALKDRECGALERLRTLIPAEIPIVAAGDLGREPRSLEDLAAIASDLHELDARPR